MCACIVNGTVLELFYPLRSEVDLFWRKRVTASLNWAILRDWQTSAFQLILEFIRTQRTKILQWQDELVLLWVCRHVWLWLFEKGISDGSSRNLHSVSTLPTFLWKWGRENLLSLLLSLLPFRWTWTCSKPFVQDDVQLELFEMQSDVTLWNHLG